MSVVAQDRSFKSGNCLVARVICRSWGLRLGRDGLGISRFSPLRCLLRAPPQCPSTGPGSGWLGWLGLGSWMQVGDGRSLVLAPGDPFWMGMYMMSARYVLDYITFTHALHLRITQKETLSLLLSCWPTAAVLRQSA